MITHPVAFLTISPFNPKAFGVSFWTYQNYYLLIFSSLSILFQLVGCNTDFVHISPSFICCMPLSHHYSMFAALVACVRFRLALQRRPDRFGRVWPWMTKQHRTANRTGRSKQDTKFVCAFTKQRVAHAALPLASRSTSTRTAAVSASFIFPSSHFLSPLLLPVRSARSSGSFGSLVRSFVHFMFVLCRLLWRANIHSFLRSSAWVHFFAVKTRVSCSFC